jgi:hypothetical protein
VGVLLRNLLSAGPTLRAMSSLSSEPRDLSQGTAAEDHSNMNRALHSGGASHEKESATTGASNDTTSEQKEAPQHGFRMQVQALKGAPPRKRKRDVVGNQPPAPAGSSPNMSLSSSSSSSSDEDEQEAKRKTAIADSGDQELVGTRNKSLEGDGGTFLPQEGTLINGIPLKGRYRSLSPERETLARGESAETTKEGKSSMPQLHGHNGHAHPSGGWRVKLYRLNSDGSWDDCGTGSILCLYKKSGHAPLTPAGQNAETPPSQLSGDAWIYHELGEPTLCMHSEVKHPTAGVSPAPKILLRTRILLRDAYQRQGDNIITWCEPYLEEGNSAQGVDLALSFQEISGCLDIWHQITDVQSKAAELFQKDDNDRGGPDSSMSQSSKLHGGVNGGNAGEEKGRGSVDEMAHAVAAAHHANLQRQQQQEMWVNVASEAAQHHLDHQNTHSLSDRDHEHPFEEESMVAAYHESSSGPQSVASSNPQSPQLPNPPGLSNLEEIADTIAAVQVC